jgi:hypothetical protein
MFLSFDFAAGGWGVDTVVNLINQFKYSPAQTMVNGVPLVSTFEGPNWAGNWRAVEQQTGEIFLVPDWSSLGAQGLNNVLDIIDGACMNLVNSLQRRCANVLTICQSHGMPGRSQTSTPRPRSLIMLTSPFLAARNT